MKRSKIRLFIIILVGFMSAFSFTSCDEENDILTEDEIEDEEENNFSGCRLETVSYYVYENPYQFSYDSDGKLVTAFQNLPVTYTDNEITMLGSEDSDNYKFVYGDNGLVEKVSREEINYRGTDWEFTYDNSGKIISVYEKFVNYGDNSESEILHTISYSGGNVIEIAQDFPPSYNSTNIFNFSNYDDGLSLGQQLTAIFENQPAFIVLYGSSQSLYQSGILSENNPRTITGPDFYFDNGEMTIDYEYDDIGNVVKVTSSEGIYSSFDATYECN